MKILKILGKVVKWYSILTVGLWAFVGISELADEYVNDYEKYGDVRKPMKMDELIITRAWRRFKRLISL